MSDAITSSSQRTVHLSDSYKALELWRLRKDEDDRSIVMHIPQKLKDGLLKVGDVIASFSGSSSSMHMDIESMNDDNVTDKSWEEAFEKSGKIQAVVEDFPSWREKCIQVFDLKQAPNALFASMTEGSESAWEQYFMYRARVEMHSSHITDDGEDDCDYYEYVPLMKVWKDGMEDKIDDLMEENCQWQWTPDFHDVVWEDPGEDVRSATYSGHVWSPFAFPRCIVLRHYYYCRPRMSTVGFETNWNYQLVDFEGGEEELRDDRSQELCSNCYDDEELRADVINTENLNEYTLRKMRRHIYGPISEKSKSLTCSDKNFLFLLFGSMGTIDPKLQKDPMRGHLGYVWNVHREEEREEFFKAKVPENDDPNSTFPESVWHYDPEGCSWLYHRVLEVTNSLGPFTKHYREPTIKDAMGYRSDGYDEDDNYKDEYYAYY